MSEINVNDFKWFTDHGYRINMELDNLPVVSTQSNDLTPGYPIGYIENGGYYINNHITLEIEIHPVKKNEYRIVGFKVQPNRYFYSL